MSLGLGEEAAAGPVTIPGSPHALHSFFFCPLIFCSPEPGSTGLDSPSRELLGRERQNGEQAIPQPDAILGGFPPRGVTNRRGGKPPMRSQAGDTPLPVPRAGAVQHRGQRQAATRPQRARGCASLRAAARCLRRYLRQAQRSATARSGLGWAGGGRAESPRQAAGSRLLSQSPGWIRPEGRVEVTSRGSGKV